MEHLIKKILKLIPVPKDHFVGANIPHNLVVEECAEWRRGKVLVVVPDT